MLQDTWSGGSTGEKQNKLDRPLFASTPALNDPGAVDGFLLGNYLVLPTGEDIWLSSTSGHSWQHGAAPLPSCPNLVSPEAIQTCLISRPDFSATVKQHRPPDTML